MKGILFKSWKIKAIADSPPDFVWQTRRVMNPQPVQHEYGLWVWKRTAWRNGVQVSDLSPVDKGRYQTGDTVYIKEAWQLIEADGEYNDFGVIYSDGDCVWWRDNGNVMLYPIDEKKRSPRFMPAWAARYFIQITNVRAERLQLALSQEDFQAEGGEQALEILEKINGLWVFVYTFKKVLNDNRKDS